MWNMDRSGIRNPFNGVTVPCTELATLRYYHRPEQKFVEAPVTRVFFKTPDAFDLLDETRGTLIPVRIVRGANRFDLEFDTGAIVEAQGNVWRLMEIAVAPGLLESDSGSAPGGGDADGEYLLPLYNGMSAPFRQSARVVSRDRIYMQQNEWEKFGLANAFGARWRSGAVLGIVDSGDFRAWVETVANFTPGRNRQYAVFGIRHAPGDFPEQEIKRVRFVALPGATDFTAMAFAYRDYLTGDRRIAPLRERVADNPVLDYAVHAMRVKIFMGQKHPFVADGKAPYRNCTTFDEAGEILDAMHAAGIGKAIITLVGWNLDGHDGAYPARFPVNAEAGGEPALRRLIQKGLAMGYQVVPHDGIGSLYTASPDFDPAYISRDDGGEWQCGGMWAGGLTYKACPQIYMQRWGTEFARVAELGFRGCYYIDGYAGGIFRCADPAHPADEKAFARGEIRPLELARAMYGAVSTETPAAYALEFIDEAAHLQNADTYANYRAHLPAIAALGAQCVPFFNLAVHGLIVYQTHWIHQCRRGGLGRGILQQFAEGARPAMEVSYRALANGDAFRDSIRDIRKTYQINFERIPEIHTAAFESYCESDGAVRLAYDCGVALEINPAAGTLRIERGGKTIEQECFA